MAVVAVNITTESYNHLLEIIDFVVQGRPSNVSINTKVQPLIDALYHVLAGGMVSGSVPGTLTITAGLQTKVNDLKTMEAACIKNINDTNVAAGFGLVLEV